MAETEEGRQRRPSWSAFAARNQLPRCSAFCRRRSYSSLVIAPESRAFFRSISSCPWDTVVTSLRTSAPPPPQALKVTATATDSAASMALCVVMFVSPVDRNSRSAEAQDLASPVTSTFFQVLSGLKRVILPARPAVFGPRSFWYTTPSWLTMKVITPEEPYFAGK